MTNCWTILEIPLTHDVGEISKARRALIRRWHPDTVSDPEQRNEYTTRCAVINAAYDEAIRIAGMRERVLKTSPRPADIDTESLRSNLRRDRTFSSSGLRAVPPLAALLSIVYLVTFRVSVPATALALIFLAGAVVAAVADLVVYRLAVRPLLSILPQQHREMLPWILLELINVLVVSVWFARSMPIFQAGIVLTIPLWRSWRWLKEKRLRSGFAD